MRTTKKYSWRIPRPISRSLAKLFPELFPETVFFRPLPCKIKKTAKKNNSRNASRIFARNPGWLSHVIPAGFLPVIPVAAIEWLAIIPVAGGLNPCGNNSRPFDLWICTRAKFKLSWFRNHWKRTIRCRANTFLWSNMIKHGYPCYKDLHTMGIHGIEISIPRKKHLKICFLIQIYVFVSYIFCPKVYFLVQN